MSLENIVRKIGKFIGATILSGTMLFTACGKWNPLQPADLEQRGSAYLTQSSTNMFNGDTENRTFSASDNNGVYSAIAQTIRPNGTAETYTIKSAGKAQDSVSLTLPITYDTNGTWKLITSATDNLGNVTSTTQSKVVYMNELQTDAIASNYCVSKKETGTGLHNKLEDFAINNSIGGGYNVDVEGIRGDFSTFYIHIIGSKNDPSNTTAISNDASANGYGFLKINPGEDIEVKIQDFLDNH